MDPSDPRGCGYLLSELNRELLPSRRSEQGVLIAIAKQEFDESESWPHTQGPVRKGASSLFLTSNEQCTVALAGCGFLWLVRAGLHLPGLQPNPLKPCSPSSVSYLQLRSGRPGRLGLKTCIFKSVANGAPMR